MASAANAQQINRSVVYNTDASRTINATITHTPPQPRSVRQDIQRLQLLYG